MGMMIKERILIVDDEEDILELLRYNLAAEGYETVCAETGEQALEIAKSGNLNLIVLDLMLPGISGLEAARLLKEDAETRPVPIIMLTAK